MIDRSKKYWIGQDVEDIIEYINAYSENTIADTKVVNCAECGSNIFELRVDTDEGAIQIECSSCKTKKFLLDSEEIWDECEPEKGKCPICKSKNYNIAVGFVRRENGSVKWVYIGNRCTNCGTLGSYADWKIDYEPTDELEKNI